MTEWLWRIIAWVITRRPLNDWIVTRALRVLVPWAWVKFDISDYT